MYNLAKLITLWLGATLTAASPLLGTQITINANSIPLDRPDDVFHNTAGAALNLTIAFDDVDLMGKPYATLTTHGYMDFARFDVVNTTAAADAGLLDRLDMDCATSSPNAIRSTPDERFPSPSLIRANATVLAARNLSTTFDFRGFSVKPLGLVGLGTLVRVRAWHIVDGKPDKLPYSLYIGWRTIADFVRPITVQPGQLFPGWGKGVNWIEVDAIARDGAHMDFCMDDLLFDFYYEAGVEDGRG